MPDNDLDAYLDSLSSPSTPAVAPASAPPKPKRVRTVSSGNPQYDSYFDQAAEKYDVDPDLLVEQDRQESTFNRKAVSPKGATGISQFMPDTAREYGLKVGNGVDDRTDPAKSIDAQGRMMRELLDKHQGNRDAALAGYNSGHHLSTDRALRNYQRIPETRNYVDTINGRLAKRPQTAGATAPDANQSLDDFLDQTSPQEPQQQVAPPASGANGQQTPTVQPALTRQSAEGEQPLTGTAGQLLSGDPKTRAAYEKFVKENAPTGPKGQALNLKDAVKDENLASIFQKDRDLEKQAAASGPVSEQDRVMRRAQMGLQFIYDDTQNGKPVPPFLHKALLLNNWTPEELKRIQQDVPALYQQIAERRGNLQPAADSASFAGDAPLQPGQAPPTDPGMQQAPQMSDADFQQVLSENGIPYARKNDAALRQLAQGFQDGDPQLSDAFVKLSDQIKTASKAKQKATRDFKTAEIKRRRKMSSRPEGPGAFNDLVADPDEQQYQIYKQRYEDAQNAYNNILHLGLTGTNQARNPLPDAVSLAPGYNKNTGNVEINQPTAGAIKTLDPEQISAIHSLGRTPEERVALAKSMNVDPSQFADVTAGKASGTTNMPRAIAGQQPTQDPGVLEQVSDQAKDTANALWRGVYHKTPAELNNFSSKFFGLLNRVDPTGSAGKASEWFGGYAKASNAEAEKQAQDEALQNLIKYGSGKQALMSQIAEATGAAPGALMKYAMVTAMIELSGGTATTPAVMALTAGIENHDAGAEKLLLEMGKGYLSGHVIHQFGKLGRGPGAAAFGALSAGQTLAETGDPRKALAAGVSGAIVGGVMAKPDGIGFKELPKEFSAAAVRTGIAPDWVNDKLADVANYGKALIKSKDGRTVSLYADPKTGKVYGEEIPRDQADQYDPQIITGEARPVRPTDTLTSEQYDALLERLGISTNGAGAKRLGGDVEIPERPVAPEEKTVSGSVERQPQGTDAWRFEPPDHLRYGSAVSPFGTILPVIPEPETGGIQGEAIDLTPPRNPNGNQEVPRGPDVQGNPPENRAANPEGQTGEAPVSPYGAVGRPIDEIGQDEIGGHAPETPNVAPEQPASAGGLASEQIQTLAQQAERADNQIRVNRVENPQPDTDFSDAEANIPPDVASQFDAHGMVRGSKAEMLQQLDGILRNGLDPNRGLNTQRLGQGSEYGMNGQAFRHGAPFVLLSEPGKMLADGAVKNVVVNETFYHAIPVLEKAYPDVNFIRGDQADTVLPQLAKGGTDLSETPLYHGGAGRFDSFDSARFGKGVGYNEQGSGVYLTTDGEGYGRYFAREASAKDAVLRGASDEEVANANGVVMQVKVKPGLNMLDLDNDRFTPKQGEAFLKGMGVPERLIEIAKRKAVYTHGGEKHPITEPRTLWDSYVQRHTQGDTTPLLRALGYDGLIFKEPRDAEGWKRDPDARTAMIFDPKNVEVQPEGPPNGGERRTDVATRKRVDQMSDEEKNHELLTDELTGIPNQRAYDEAPKKPVQFITDMDNLKVVNDTLGHESGSELLKAKAQALVDEGLDPYRFSRAGDEFGGQGDDADVLRAKLERAAERFSRATIDYKTPDGRTFHYEGPGFSFGIGPDLKTADAALQQHKAAREASGQRAARGEKPRGLVEVTPTGRETDGETSSEEVSRAKATETYRHIRDKGLIGAPGKVQWAEFATGQRGISDDRSFYQDNPSKQSAFLLIPDADGKAAWVFPHPKMIKPESWRAARFDVAEAQEGRSTPQRVVKNADGIWETAAKEVAPTSKRATEEVGGLRIITGRELGTLAHGTTPENAASIRKSGKFDLTGAKRNYDYSEFGPDSLYFARPGAWWLNPEEASKARAVEYKDSVQAKLDDDARVVVIKSRADAEALAKAAGFTDLDEMRDHLNFQGFTDGFGDAKDAFSVAEHNKNLQLSRAAVQKLKDLGIDAIHIEKDSVRRAADWRTATDEQLQEYHNTRLPFADQQTVVINPEKAKPVSKEEAPETPKPAGIAEPGTPVQVHTRNESHPATIVGHNGRQGNGQLYTVRLANGKELQISDHNLSLGEVPDRTVTKQANAYIAPDGSGFSGKGAKRLAEEHARHVSYKGALVRSYGGGVDRVVDVDMVDDSPTYTVVGKDGETRRHRTLISDKDVIQWPSKKGATNEITTPKTSEEHTSATGAGTDSTPAPSNLDVENGEAENLGHGPESEETGTGGLGEVREPRQPAHPTVEGSKTAVSVPGTNKAYPARFVVREVEDVYPSHNPHNFQPNPEYHHLNDRQYDQEKQYQQQVINRSRADGPEPFNPSHVINNSPTVDTGPPAIDEDGNAIGGNSRAMILHRIYEAKDPTMQRQYKEALLRQAAIYGLDPQKIGAMRKPVLVRMLADEGFDTQQAITDLNKPSTTPLTQKEQAAAAAGNLSEASAAFIVGKIEAMGDGATLNDVLNEKGVDIINRLVDDGIFTPGERNVLLDDGKITDDGKKRIERMLTSMVFRDGKQLEDTPPIVRNNVVRIVGPLMRVSGTDWDITNAVRNAIDAIQEKKATGFKGTWQDFANQPSLVRQRPFTPAELAIADTLGKGPILASRPFKVYAADHADAASGGGLFGARTKEESFEANFGAKIDTRGKFDAQSTRRDLERDSQRGDENPIRQEVLSNEPGPTDLSNGPGGATSGSAGSGPAGNSGLPDGGAIDSGAGGDSQVRGNTPGDQGSAAGSALDKRRAGSGNTGVSPEQPANGSTAETSSSPNTALSSDAISDLVTKEFEAMFGGEPKAPETPAVQPPTTTPRTPRSNTPRQPRTSTPGQRAGSAAKDAASESAKGLADVAKGLGELFKGGAGGGTPRIGPAFDEETYEKAKPLFIKGVKHFANSGRSLSEMVRALLEVLRDQFGLAMDQIREMLPYIARFVEDVQNGVISLADEATEKVAKTVDAFQSKREAQREAAKVKYKANDLDNIKESLPFLMEPQQKDVLFAETRLTKPDGFGVMFTNGTGTGKTYTGLGIAKRFIQQGKDNILILAPSDTVIAAWLEAAKNLDVELNKLEDTKSNGGLGPTITTYANFGQNNTLAEREWDLIIPDEAHYLAQNAEGDSTSALASLRAITMHPDGLSRRVQMLTGDEHAELAALQDRTSRDARGISGADRSREQELIRKIEDKRKEVREQLEAMKPEERSRVTFLSATPFAYEKTIDYANGYLFDYNEGQADDSGRMGYNSGSNRERFFIQHFGYRMRYNKLTEPDANVDRGVMQRNFNQHLKDQGVLRGRILDVPLDYDRKFLLTEDAVGRKIDEGIDFLTNGEDGKFRPLWDIFNQNFKYLDRMFLLEAIKAKHAVGIIKQHLDLGRKVVVFHDYNKGGGFHPFDLPRSGGQVTYTVNGTTTTVDINDLIDDFEASRPDLVNLDFSGLGSPIDTLSAAFPDLLQINGRVPKKTRAENVKKFNDDNSGHNVILVQSDAGREGISLHDTTNVHQRALINLGMPVKPTASIQQEGRIARLGMLSNAIQRYMNTGTNFERWTFASKIAERASTAENLAMGALARDLKTSFIDGFMDSDLYPPRLGEGVGGKEQDALADASITPYDKAKSYYFGQQKKTSRNKSREGVDYFATPEPIGFKMVEWLGLKPNEKVLEPSGGHGAVARFFPEDAKVTVIEPSFELGSRAALVSHGQLIPDIFENHHIVNKYHGIAMNPPFGQGGKTAIDHLRKAMGHLRNGGRIVALLPEGPTADKRLEKLLYEDEAANGIYKVADIRLPDVAFERAATRVRTHLVILERQDNPEDAAKIQERHRDFSDATDINDLFDQLEHVAFPDRVKPTQAEVEEVAADNQDYELKDFSHSKTGATMYVASPKKYLGDGYTAANVAARRAGGYYSKYKQDGAIPGFLFKSAEDRNKFLTEMSKPDADLSEAGFGNLGSPEPTGYEPENSGPGQKIADLRGRMRDAYNALTGNGLEASRNYDQMGAFRDVFVRNGAQLEKADEDSYNAFLKAAGARTTGKMLMRRAAYRIQDLLKTKGGWDNFRAALVESRLIGAQERWHEFGTLSRDLDDEDFQTFYGGSKDEPGIRGLLDKLDRSPFIREFKDENDIDPKSELTAVVDSALAADDLDTARSFLENVFRAAADNVTHVMSEDTFDALVQSPEFREALPVYKDLLERPMAESHALNEGIFSDATGPLDTYYPLIPLDKDGRPNRKAMITTKRGSEYRIPDNIHNRFATGHSPMYDLTAEGLAGNISRAERANKVASLLRTLETNGLIRKLKKKEAAPETIMFEGEEYKATAIPRGKDRTLFLDGKTIHIPAERVLVPNWLKKELKPLLETDDVDQAAVVKLFSKLNIIGMAGPIDAAAHTANVIGALVAGTPYIGTSLLGKTIFNTAATKIFTAWGKLLATDPWTDDAIKDIEDMTELGLIPTRYASEVNGWLAKGRKFADMTGAKKKYLSLGPLLMGPGGIDIRARLLMFRLSREMNPNAKPKEVKEFVNQLGNYTYELQGQLERAVKRSAFAPFYTAGSTMYRVGIKTVFGANPLPTKGLPLVKRIGLRLAMALSAGAAGLIGLWVLSSLGYRGKLPWHDPQSRFMQIPLNDRDRKHWLAKKLYGDNDKTAYVGLGFFSPLVERGSRALGISGAYNASMNGATAGQASEAGEKDVMNSLLHPFTSGPMFHSAFVMGTTKEPYIQSLRDFTGNRTVELMSTTHKTEPGIATWKARSIESVAALNNFYGDVARNIGLVQNTLGLDDAGKGKTAEDQQANKWLRMAFDLAAPRLAKGPVDLSKQRKGFEKQEKAINSMRAKPAQIPTDMRRSVDTELDRLGMGAGKVTTDLNLGKMQGRQKLTQQQLDDYSQAYNDEFYSAAEKVIQNPNYDGWTDVIKERRLRAVQRQAHDKVRMSTKREIRVEGMNSNSDIGPRPTAP